MPRLAVAMMLLALPALAADKEEKEEKDHPVLARVKKAKVTGPFTLVVSLQVKKGKEKAFMDVMRPCVAASVKEEGCVAYELSRDAEDGTRFIIYEKWKSPAALGSHLKTDHFKKLAESLGDLLNGGVEARVCKTGE
jgi:quinol monooxygenase YgiN